MRSFVWLSIALTLAISCSDRASSAQTVKARDEIAGDTNVVITLERTNCYGTCPAYSLHIYGNGIVQYTGKMHVAISGEQTARVPLDSVWALVDAFRDIGYFSFKDEYRTAENGLTVTDLSSTITSLSVSGTTKRVVDYYVRRKVCVSWKSALISSPIPINGQG